MTTKFIFGALGALTLAVGCVFAFFKKNVGPTVYALICSALFSACSTAATGAAATGHVFCSAADQGCAIVHALCGQEAAATHQPLPPPLPLAQTDPCTSTGCQLPK